MGTETSYGWNTATGMTLLAKLKSDLKGAMLSKNETVKGALRIIISEFPTKITMAITLESGEKRTRAKRDDEITDDDILSLIMGLCKSERQTLEYKKEASSEYLEILEAYLPKMATEGEIAAWAKENIDLSQFKSAMQAMGPIMKHFGKSADGNVVKKVLADMAG